MSQQLTDKHLKLLCGIRKHTLGKRFYFPLLLDANKEGEIINNNFPIMCYEYRHGKRSQVEKFQDVCRQEKEVL